MKKIVSTILCLVFVFAAISISVAAESAQDPSSWTTQQIVEYYKQAAAKSDGRSSGVYDVTMKGAYATFLEPIVQKFFEEPDCYNGITGNYSNLSAADIQSASAILEGNCVIVNLQAKGQTYDNNDETRDGSTTRLVDSKQYAEITAESYGANELTAQYVYSNAYAKDIKINVSTGKIEDGQWGYDVNAKFNVKIGGSWINNVEYDAAYTVSYQYDFIPTTINSVEFPEEISVKYKDSATLVPTVDATSEDYTIKYESSDYNVISVSEDGQIETFGRGTAIVTCTVEGEGGNTVTKTCTVNVYYTPIQWIIIIFLFGWLWY